MCSTSLRQMMLLTKSGLSWSAAHKAAPFAEACMGTAMGWLHAIGCQ